MKHQHSPDDEAKIRALALQFFEEEGSPNGCALEHWLRAEREVTAGSAATEARGRVTGAPPMHETGSMKAFSGSHEGTAAVARILTRGCESGFEMSFDRFIGRLAERYGVSEDAVVTLSRALERGGGRLAQFSHPELGGYGQWMPG